MTTVDPIPLDPALTVKWPTPRHRMETWEATSADGVWTFIREESPGTPWVSRHNPTGRVGGMAGTLRLARIAAAAGWTLADLDRETADREARDAARQTAGNRRSAA